MKTKNLLFKVLAFSLILLTCTEEKLPLQILPPVEGGTWEIFQLAKIHAPDILVEDNSFSGSIEGVPVSLGRIPGDTLVFIIPNVGDGPAQLKVIMGKQVRSWVLVLDFFPYYNDQKTFFDLFFEKTSELHNRILEVEKLKELSVPFGIWIAFFNKKKAALTGTEIDWLSGIMQHIGAFMHSPKDTFELECIKTPDFYSRLTDL